MKQGFPVVIVESGGIPVTPVASNAPLMRPAANGKGVPITLTDKGAPFIVEGQPLNAFSDGFTVGFE